jgi:hypothetical protein
MSYRDKEGYYEASTYLGNKIGNKFPFLQKTACMDIDTRRILAILEFVKETESVESKKEIEEVEPLFMMLGEANWSRDVISDMAIKLGMNIKSSKFKVKKKDVGTIRDPERPEDDSNEDL